MSEPLLAVDDLRVHLFTNRGVVRAVDGVGFALSAGESLGIVGESGCGKTMTALSLMRLIPSPPARIVSGRIMFDGEDVVALDEPRLRALRGNAMAMIYQDPMTTLNPVFSVGEQIAEAVRLHRRRIARRGAGTRGRDARAGRHSRSRTLRAVLSAPAFRWHAPTCGDRHGAGVPSQAADRR